MTKDLEKQIEEDGVAFVENHMKFSFKSMDTLSMAKRLLNAYKTGAKSEAAKKYWQQGMYTEEEFKILARRCWNAADDFREELDRINAGRSNFDKPHSPNFKKWIEQNKKSI